MISLLEVLKQNIFIKKAIYFTYSLGMTYYEIPLKEKILTAEGYREAINPALEEIKKVIQQKDGNREELKRYLWDIEPYLAYLLSETPVSTELIVLSFLNKDFDLWEIFSLPLESLPQNADSKYGIVLLDNNSCVNHQGIISNNIFYYYNPFYNSRRNAKKAPYLIQLLFDQRDLGNLVSLRLDQSISIPKKFYIPFFRDVSEIYQGREIDLDDIKFPLYPGQNEFLCVYNPYTMKKIQFKISHRRDSELWIEIEELWDTNGETDQKCHITRYLHSIFNPLTNCFNHIDGSINFYNNNNYKIRINQQINAHSDLHVKQWLVEGEVSIKDWAKMILHFYNDPDLIIDAFRGNLIKEVFS